MFNEWKKFKKGKWNEGIDVEDFILNNYKYYDKDDSFLAGISHKSKRVWEKCKDLLKEELKKGVLDIEVDKVSGINSFEAGYIDEKKEVIVGLQTDAPLKRMINPYGGIRMVYSSLEAYDYKLNSDIDKYFNNYRKTHNQGVFDCYTKEMRAARKYGLLTGLPDAYGRGRIIGDYRRVA